MVGNDIVNFVDYLGLSGVDTEKRKCLWLIMAGHAGSVDDFVSGLKTPPQCGDTLSGVSCLRGSVNNRINDKFPGKVTPGAETEDNRLVYPDDSPKRGNNPGFADEVNKAFEAAVAGAEKACEAEGNCCREIKVKVNCLDNDARRVLNRLGKTKCDREKVVSCSQVGK